MLAVHLTLRPLVELYAEVLAVHLTLRPLVELYAQVLAVHLTLRVLSLRQQRFCDFYVHV